MQTNVQQQNIPLPRLFPNSSCLDEGEMPLNPDSMEQIGGRQLAFQKLLKGVKILVANSNGIWTCFSDDAHHTWAPPSQGWLPTLEKDCISVSFPIRDTAVQANCV